MNTEFVQTPGNSKQSKTTVIILDGTMNNSIDDIVIPLTPDFDVPVPKSSTSFIACPTCFIAKLKEGYNMAQLQNELDDKNLNLLIEHDNVVLIEGTKCDLTCAILDEDTTQ